MQLPSLLTSSSSSSPPSSWLSPTLISDPTRVGSSLTVTTRVLHLAPSRQLNESWYISLIQEARTWEGNLCLHLQPHPIPWIFVVQNDDDNDDDDDDDIENHHEPVAAAAATVMPTSLHVSEVVWSELMALLQNLPKQGRGLHLILEKDFIPNLTPLKHLLTVAAPSLIRIETDHPCLLNDLVPNMATRCPYLRTLAMDIQTTLRKFQSHPHHNPLVALTLFLRDPFCQLKGLHLHFSSSTTAPRQRDATRKQQLLPILDLFATLADCLHNRRTIQALKISGGQLDSVLNALLYHDWPCQQNMSPGSSSLKKLEIESSHLQLVVVPNDDETIGIHNVHNHDITVSTSALANFVQSSVVENMTHLTIRVKEIKVQTLPTPLQQEPAVCTSSLSTTILPDSIVVSSLTHLTLQAGLTTSMVDSLLVQLNHATPNLQELDLEGNDMESLELPKFLLTVHDNHSRHRFQNLQKLFLGSNLFSYTTQREWIERLVYTCPRLDVGHRGMPSCGILDDEYENGLFITDDTGRYQLGTFNAQGLGMERLE